VRNHRRAGGRELGAERIEALVAARQQHELGAFARELAREGGAYARRRTRDQDDVVLKFHSAAASVNAAARTPR